MSKTIVFTDASSFLEISVSSEQHGENLSFFFLLQYLQSFQQLNWKDLRTSLIPQTNTPGSSMPSNPSTKNFCLASDLRELEAPGDERSLGIPPLDDD